MQQCEQTGSSQCWRTNQKQGNVPTTKRDKWKFLFVEHHLRSFWFCTGGEERILAALFSPPLPGKLLSIKTNKDWAAAVASASSMALHCVTKERRNSVSETAEQQLLLSTLYNRPSLNFSFLKQNCRAFLKQELLQNFTLSDHCP